MRKGFWDIHNHILPGLDDGACNMEETLQLVKEEYEQGIRNIIFTPHFRTGMFEVSRKEQIQVFKEVTQELRMHFPDMLFCLGCEYYVHHDVVADLDAAPYRIAATKAVLVEFSTRQSFLTIKTAVERIIQTGYTPIIAHVERYRCLIEEEGRLALLKEAGALIQINADAVLGNAGAAITRFCKNALAGDLVDFVASDAHDKKLRGVRMLECIRLIEKKHGKAKVEKLFIENPKALFPKELFVRTER